MSTQFRSSLALAACAILVACDRRDPPAPTTSPAPASTQVINAKSGGAGASAAPPKPALSEAKLIEMGKALHTNAGCNLCHTVDGNKGPGPTMKGLYGSTVRLSDGTTVVADEAYLKRSILDPMAEVVEGYPPQMLPYQGILTEEKIDALVAYIKSLGSAPASPPSRGSP